MLFIYTYYTYKFTLNFTEAKQMNYIDFRMNKYHLYIHMHIHTYTCIFICTHTGTYTYKYILHTYTYRNTYMYTHIISGSAHKLYQNWDIVIKKVWFQMSFIRYECTIQIWTSRKMIIYLYTRMSYTSRHLIEKLGRGRADFAFYYGYVRYCSE